MPDCAFCPHSGKLSAEHIVAKWMRDLFPHITQAWYGKHVFRSSTLDWKASVVCENCNNGWMSEIEAQHAKPALPPLILGEDGFPISESMARSIALYAFKTAVVLDHAHRDSPPFFAVNDRYAFRERLVIPSNVGIWICPYPTNRGGGHFKTAYAREKHLTSPRHLQLYACTFALGFLAVQILAVSTQLETLIQPGTTFKHLAIPIWPTVPVNQFWRKDRGLSGIDEFVAFAHLWDTIIAL